MTRAYSTARDRLAQRAASPSAPARDVVEGRQPVAAVLDGTSPDPTWRTALQPVMDASPVQRTVVNVEQFLAAQTPSQDVEPSRAPRLN